MRYFFHTRVSCTDRAREKVVQHGSWHGPCPLFSVARVFNTGRVREACALISRVARGVLRSTRTVLSGLHGSRLALHGACQAVLRLSTGRVSPVHTGRANQHGSLILHGSRLLQHGSSLVQHGACNFSPSEVGTLNFLSFQGLL